MLKIFIDNLVVFFFLFYSLLIMILFLLFITSYIIFNDIHTAKVCEIVIDAATVDGGHKCKQQIIRAIKEYNKITKKNENVRIVMILH